MGSLRVFVARGLLLILMAIISRTNGQMLTEKIPLGKVEISYGNSFSSLILVVIDVPSDGQCRTKKYSAAFVMSCCPFFSLVLHFVFVQKNIHSISFHNTKKREKGFAFWGFSSIFLSSFCWSLFSLVSSVLKHFRPSRRASEPWTVEKQTELRERTEILLVVY